MITTVVTPLKLEAWKTYLAGHPFGVKPKGHPFEVIPKRTTNQINGDCSWICQAQMVKV